MLLNSTDLSKNLKTTSPKSVTNMRKVSPPSLNTVVMESNITLKPLKDMTIVVLKGLQLENILKKDI